MKQVINFPTHFALADSGADAAAPSAAAPNHAGGAVVYPQPPHIPARRGANAEDLEYMSRQVKLCQDLFESAVLENAKLYRAAVVAIIECQRENVSIGHGARVESFEYTLLDILDDFDRGLADLTSDVQGDLERALEKF